MEPTETQTVLQDFAKDVKAGLSAKPKSLPSRYFYDAKGDRIFQQIMRMPEYYLTDCEYEIFDRQRQDILDTVNPGRKFNLVELGAGDGYKTKVLLKHFLNSEANFEYFPVDISGDVLQHLKNDLSQNFPGLKVRPLNYEYFKALEKLNELDDSPKVILFLGSNIGNFSPQAALSFYHHLNEVMQVGDMLLNGIDLKKDPDVILEAYNDKTGITRNFNLNLLERINRELEANFNIDKFKHYPSYDPESGEARSYLISLENQEVTIESLEQTFHFKRAEPIHMEISKKYSLEEIEELAHQTKFEVKEHFTDSRRYFVDSLWVKE